MDLELLLTYMYLSRSPSVRLILNSQFKALQNTFPKDYATRSSVSHSDVDVDDALLKCHVVYAGSSVCHVRQPALHGKSVTPLRQTLSVSRVPYHTMQKQPFMFDFIYFMWNVHGYY